MTKVNLNIIFALFLSLSYAVITVSPDGTQDFTTIQAAIDHVTANPADLEIDVYPGTYQENLLIEADMIIRSVGDADNTIIDGSLGNRSLGSTIVIRPESNTTHHPVVEIDGFSIKNGKGTDVVNKTITLTDGSHPEEKVGGGLFVYVNSPKVNNSQFLGNGDNSTDKGGAIFSVSYSDGIDFPDRPDYQDHSDLVPAEGTLDFSNNTFLGNDADYGHSVYILGDDYDEVKMIGDYLDVFSMNYESASEYWVVSDYDIDYTNASGEAEGILNDVWVDPINGTDESNISGDQNNPFLTIDYAMGMIYPTIFNPITINLTLGTIAPSTSGEDFSIIMKSNVNLIGQGEEVTILDAEQTTAPVINIDNSENNIISDMTITGGYRDLGGYAAGGIHISSSDPIIQNIKIINNYSANLGGGLFIGGSNPNINNISIISNEAFLGGGIYITNSDPILSDILIGNNIAQTGGGVYLNGSADATFINAAIVNNSAHWYGGVLYNSSYPAIWNSIIWGNTHCTQNEPPPSDDCGYPDALNASYDTPNPEYIYVNYSNIEGGWYPWNDGWVEYELINTYPFFTDPQNGDYTLQAISPCIDAGTTDIGGYADITEYCGEAPDMGAYEFITEDCEYNCGTYDECGVCGGDGSSCEFAILNFSSVTSNSLDVVMDNPIPVAGFQMVLEGIEINSISGGSSSEAEFSISFNNSTLVGFTITGDYIPPGDAVLFHVEFTPSAIEVCFQDVIVSDVNGVGVTTVLSDCSELCISGDLNCDGEVNVLDIVVLVNIVLGGTEPNDAGDLNGDGTINILDVVMLVNIILNG